MKPTFDQSGAGLEIFQRDGRYGVMRHGVVACPAKFVRMERLQPESGHFALGTYLACGKHDPQRQVEVTTVINRDGRDLGVKLRGRVCWHEGYFLGIDERGGCSYVNCWDPVGNCYYRDTHPDFHVVGGVEIGWADEHVPTSFHCKKLRYSTGRVSPRFDERDMLYNPDIVIARDYLIVKRDRNHSYRISGYLDDSVLVEGDEQGVFLQIFPDGQKGQRFSRLPKEAVRVVNPSRLGLRRVRTD